MLLLKAPHAQIEGVGRFGRGVQAIVTFVIDSPVAELRLDWHFPKGTPKVIRAIEGIPSAPLAGWLLHRLLTPERLELHLLDEELEAVGDLWMDWPDRKRNEAGVAYHNALAHLQQPDERANFFATDLDYQIREPLAT